jgi:uncharacterized SAM-binding protein YcdF (DUF218 family)
VSEARLIAVCGYSSRAGEGLHEICARRLRRAEREARPGDVVLLTGWARGRNAASEAELMARSWRGSSGRVVVDSGARSTFANVAATAAIAREVGASRIVLVTSSWHAGRAATLLRAALRGSGSTVEVAVSDDPPSLRARLRELACWTAVPYAFRASRAARRRRPPPRPAGGAPGSRPGRDGR